MGSRGGGRELQGGGTQRGEGLPLLSVLLQGGWCRVGAHTHSPVNAHGLPKYSWSSPLPPQQAPIPPTQGTHLPLWGGPFVAAPPRCLDSAEFIQIWCTCTGGGWGREEGRRVRVPGDRILRGCPHKLWCAQDGCAEPWGSSDLFFFQISGFNMIFFFFFFPFPSLLLQFQEPARLPLRLPVGFLLKSIPMPPPPSPPNISAPMAGRGEQVGYPDPCSQTSLHSNCKK